MPHLELNCLAFVETVEIQAPKSASMEEHFLPFRCFDSVLWNELREVYKHDATEERKADAICASRISNHYTEHYYSN